MICIFNRLIAKKKVLFLRLCVINEQAFIDRSVGSDSLELSLVHIISYTKCPQRLDVFWRKIDTQGLTTTLFIPTPSVEFKNALAQPIISHRYY